MSVNDAFIGAPLKNFKDEVEKRTANGVLVEILDKGVPFADGHIFAAVASGNAEMRVAGLHEVANKLPAIDTTSPPPP